MTVRVTSALIRERTAAVTAANAKLDKREVTLLVRAELGITSARYHTAFYDIGKRFTAPPSRRSRIRQLYRQVVAGNPRLTDAEVREEVRRLFDTPIRASEYGNAIINGIIAEPAPRKTLYAACAALVEQWRAVGRHKGASDLEAIIQPFAERA